MTNEKFLWDICCQGMEERAKYFVDRPQVYWRRLRGEYKLVTDLGYVDYFLIIWDIVRWAREQGIMVGPARGSVAGSLLAFLTRMTDVDPLRFGLMFERFLNPVRSKTDPPDVDLDFQASRREEVKRYIVDKYGEDRVCSIGSHSRAYASGTIKDVAKAMGLDFHRLNQVVAHKMYDMELTEAYEAYDDFKRWVDDNEEHQKCFEIACVLEGLVRHKSVHPAGLVITPQGLEEYIPTYKTNNVICTQWKDYWVAKRGLLKVDILGLNTLDILHTTMDLIGEDIDLLDIPLDDEDVLFMFEKGETLAVFQFDTYHLQKIAMRLGISSFDDLVISTTIARPGSTKIGVTDSVIRRRRGDEPTVFPHESVEELLKETQGYPIYQELVMKMAHIAGNIPLPDTEIMRDAIKHFRHSVMAEYEEDFKAGALDNGATKQQAKKMWKMIQGASGYTYNKAHATAYSLISYFCAYFKHHYPLEYMTACLKHERNSDKIPALVTEARKLNLTVLPADVNKAEAGFSTDGENIIAGLTAINYVGVKAAQSIMAHRPYKSKEDFRERVPKRTCNKRVFEALEKAGAFGKRRFNPEDILSSYGCWIGDSVPISLKRLPKCGFCSLWEERYKVVCGSGNEFADVMLVGEAPGEHEDRQGKPFVGQAGKLLRHTWIPELGVRPADVWITNVNKCIPARQENGRIGKATDQQKTICSLWLDKEIDMIEPRVIVALGSTALKAISTEMSITAMHGREFTVVTRCSGRRDGVIGFALFHPAYALRLRGKVRTQMDEEISGDLAKLREIMEEK